MSVALPTAGAAFVRSSSRTRSGMAVDLSRPKTRGAIFTNHSVRSPPRHLQRRGARILLVSTGPMWSPLGPMGVWMSWDMGIGASG